MPSVKDKPKKALDKGNGPPQHHMWQWPDEPTRHNLCQKLPPPTILSWMVSFWKGTTPPKDACVVCLGLLKQL
jgi:hypothetical protein